MAPELTADLDTPAPVRIITGRGSFETMTTVPKGAPENPLSQEELLAKFNDCADHAAIPVSRERRERIITLCEDLEHTASISELADCLY